MNDIVMFVGGMVSLGAGVLLGGTALVFGLSYFWKFYCRLRLGIYVIPAMEEFRKNHPEKFAKASEWNKRADG